MLMSMTVEQVAPDPTATLAPTLTAGQERDLLKGDRVARGAQGEAGQQDIQSEQGEKGTLAPRATLVLPAPLALQVRMEP